MAELDAQDVIIPLTLPPSLVRDDLQLRAVAQPEARTQIGPTQSRRRVAVVD